MSSDVCHTPVLYCEFIAIHLIASLVSRHCRSTVDLSFIHLPIHLKNTRLSVRSKHGCTPFLTKLRQTGKRRIHSTNFSLLYNVPCRIPTSAPVCACTQKSLSPIILFHNYRIFARGITWMFGLDGFRRHVSSRVLTLVSRKIF